MKYQKVRKMSAENNIGNLGYTASNNPFRATRDGHEYEELMTAPDWREEIVKRNGNVKDTVHEMQKLIKQYAWQTKKLSERLKGKDVYQTSKNIWQFLYNHFKYKEDDKGQEQLRTPALSWNVRTTRGIDCDDFSIFAGTLFFNLGIPFYLRIAHYPDLDHFSHVYVVVPQGNKKYIVVDAVLDSFDSEKEPILETKDFIVMSNGKLNGIDVTVLSGIETETDGQIVGLIMGAGFPDDELEGTSTEDQLDAVYKHLVETRDLISKNPGLIKNNEDPTSFLQMLDYAIQYWHTDKRDEALAILEAKENEINQLEGLPDSGDGYEQTNLYYGIEGLGGLSVLGRVKKIRAFFSKVKDVVKKAADGVKAGVKNAFKAVVHYSPLTVGARAGMLLALKLNVGKAAEKLKWGYLTEAEAKKHGFDIPQWRIMQQQLKNSENLFVDTMQGSAQNFKNAILTGRAGGLSGFSENLGDGEEEAASTMITAAMPFIKKILEWLKNVDFSKLIHGVKPETLQNGRMAAEANNPIPPDVNTDINSKPDSDTSNTSNSNLPATTNNGATTPSTTDTPDNSGTSVFSKIGDWVKENPGKTALVVGGMILAFSSKARHAVGLGGVLKVSKKKKGKKKSHPPKVISGTKRKKGKGGSSKSVKL